MRIRKSRSNDATFELNLAPFLDIVVSVIPMLLLSVAFIQIKMIETSIPQVVAQKIAEQKKNEKVPVSVTLEANRITGYTFILNENGSSKKTNLALKDGKFDFQGLQAVAAETKRKYTDIFKMDFMPKADVTYEDIVGTMDALRRLPDGQKIAFRDTKTGSDVSTDLMFPDVTFANILGD